MITHRSVLNLEAMPTRLDRRWYLTYERAFKAYMQLEDSIYGQPFGVLQGAALDKARIGWFVSVYA